jgi:hypothetical protein
VARIAAATVGLPEAEPVGRQASDRRDDQENGPVQRAHRSVGPRLQRSLVSRTVSMTTLVSGRCRDRAQCHPLGQSWVHSGEFRRYESLARVADGGQQLLRRLGQWLARRSINIDRPEACSKSRCASASYSVHVAYELLITNVAALPARIERIEARDAATQKSVLIKSGGALQRDFTPLSGPRGDESTVDPSADQRSSLLAASETWVAWMDVLVPTPPDLPARLGSSAGWCARPAGKGETHTVRRRRRCGGDRHASADGVERPGQRRSVVHERRVLSR